MMKVPKKTDENHFATEQDHQESQAIQPPVFHEVFRYAD